MRKMITEVLQSDERIEVIDSASDPYEAREKIKALNPDVMTLDIQMPKMDGLSFLEKVMTLRPMPVIMVSSLTLDGANETLKALEIGAVDYVAKPQNIVSSQFKDLQTELCSKVLMAAKSNIRISKSPITKKSKILTGERVVAHNKLIVIGSSTGGVEAINEIIPKLPAIMPPILIVQHMPEPFTKSFANRLNASSQLTVLEATSGQIIKEGHVYIAPGRAHLIVEQRGSTLQTKLLETELVSGHRPSADQLFYSCEKIKNKQIIGLILTGMGKDGADGLRNLRDLGAKTIGQSQETCVVYGMPRAAMECGAIEIELPIDHIAARLVEYSSLT